MGTMQLAFDSVCVICAVDGGQWPFKGRNDLRFGESLVLGSPDLVLDAHG